MASYKWNYLTSIGNGSGTDEEPPFDRVTEACFETEEDYQRAIAHFADEENLFDRSQIWSFVVDECRTVL